MEWRPTANCYSYTSDIQWCQFVTEEPRRDSDSSHFFGYTRYRHWYNTRPLDDTKNIVSTKLKIELN